MELTPPPPEMPGAPAGGSIPECIRREETLWLSTVLLQNERIQMTTITIADEAVLEMKKALADKGDSPCVRVYIAGFG